MVLEINRYERGEMKEGATRRAQLASNQEGNRRGVGVGLGGNVVSTRVNGGDLGKRIPIKGESFREVYQMRYERS